EADDPPDDGERRHDRPVEDVARAAGRGGQGNAAGAGRYGRRPSPRHGRPAARHHPARGPFGADEEEMTLPVARQIAAAVPVLRTERLRLRAPVPADFEHWAEYF